MRKSTAILMSMVLFFFGIIIGFLISPIKKGIYCGNNNGNNNSDVDIGENDNKKNHYDFNPKEK